MSIYDDMRSVAADVLGEFKQGEIRYVTVANAAGASPDESGSTTLTASNPLSATARPVSTKYVDGSNVVVSDIQVTIPNDGKCSPDMNGFVRIDGTDYKIMAVMARPAAGDPVSWTVIVRR